MNHDDVQYNIGPPVGFNGYGMILSNDFIFLTFMNTSRVVDSSQCDSTRVGLESHFY